jgi:hypothetical protein
MTIDKGDADYDTAGGACPYKRNGILSTANNRTAEAWHSGENEAECTQAVSKSQVNSFATSVR